MIRFFKHDPKVDELPKEVAHVELKPGIKKPPKEIPVLKIIITALAIGLVAGLIAIGVLLILIQNDYLEKNRDAKTVIEARIKSYPKPIKNICGEEVAICGDGTVTEKTGIECEFRACPDFASDMTRFWAVKNSEEKFELTYQNLDLDYEFDILKTWDFIGLDYGFILYSPNYDCGKQKSANKSICDGTIIEMLTSITTAKDDIEVWYKSSENHLVNNSDNPPPKTYNLINIAGQKAIEVENSAFTRSYFFINDNFVFVIRTTSAGELDFELAKPHITKLIETFRFLQIQ